MLTKFFNKTKILLKKFYFLVFYLFRHPRKFWQAMPKKTQKWTLRSAVVLLIILLAIPISIWFSSEKIEAAWWNDMWLYRKPIAVTNSSGGVLTDFQVKILSNVDLSADITAGKIQADLDDLRFTDVNGNLLPYWIEDSTAASVDVWVKMSTIPTTGATAYMYYGNPSAGAYNNFSGMTTGGTVTTTSGYRIHTFTSSGTFTSGPITTVENLVVAGGGGGGSSATSSGGGGGGGGGGLVYNAALAVTAGQLLTVSIGNGGSPGTAGANQSGSNGENSVFGSITATGGGGGARTGVNGNAGGSGGGGGYNGYSVVRSGGSGVSGQGNAGGNTSMLSWAGGAGGGGAGGVGGDNKINHGGGDRGLGLAYSISGGSVTYAGGGGGGSNSPVASPANTGKGGDAAYSTGTAYAGAAGIIIVKYAVASEPVAAAPATEEKGAGPAGYWSFDEGYGVNVNDSTANNSDGTITGALWKMESECVIGKCLWFDGSDDQVSRSDGGTTDPLRLTGGEITFEAWVKPFSTTGEQKIIDKRVAWNGLYGYSWFFSGTQMYLEYGNGASYVQSNKDIGSAYSANNWHHVVITLSGSTITYYMDGKSYGTNNAIAGIAADTTAFSIGRSAGRGIGPFKGSIDEPKIYPYARTAAQIKMDYNAGLAGTGGASGAAVSLGGRSDKWLTDGLVGYWKMDESSWGSVTDASGNGNTGTAYNGATVATGKFGNSGSFDSVDDVVKITSSSGDELNPLNYISISAWVYVNSAKDNSYVVAKGWGDNYELVLNASNQVLFKIVNTPSSDMQTVTSTSALPTGTWQHVVGVYDKNKLKIYINGVYNNSANYDKTIYQGGQSLGIGGIQHMQTAYPNNGLNGKVDEARIYNRALSPQEVSDLYNFAPEPVAEWKMDEKSGQYAYDTSGNSNNGTLGSGSGSDSADPAWVAGKFGGGLKTDGSNDYVDAGNVATYNFGTGGFTIMGWIYTQGEPNSFGAALIDKSSGDFTNTASNQKGFWLTPARNAGPVNTIAWGVGNGSGYNVANYAISNASLLNHWHHVVGVADDQANTSPKLKLYVDGVLVSSTTRTYLGSIDETTQNLNIGRWRLVGRTVNGTIDDVKMYNYARTDKQIVEDMNGGHPAGGSPVASQAGYWKFDEGQGGTAYNFGSGGTTYDGTITGATWSNDGKFGKALNFANSQYVFVPGDPLRNFTQLSISAWVKPSSDTYIFQHGSSYSINGYVNYFKVTSGGALSIDIEDAVTAAHFTPSSASGLVSMGSWSYVSAVVKSNTVEFYVNGKKVYTSGTFNGMYTLAATADAYRNIGRYNYNGTTINYSSGLIDEVKVYNYALTEDEVKLDMNQGKSMQLGTVGTTATGAPSNSADRAYCPPGDTTASCGPVGEWKLDEKSGGNAYDTSGNGTTGVWGGTGTHWASGKFGSAGNFNGSDDYIQAAYTDALAPTAAITVQAWAYHDNWAAADSTAGGFNPLVSKTQGGGYALSIGDASTIGDNNIGVCFRRNGAYGCANVALSTLTSGWHYFAGSYDGRYTKLYVDGVLKNTNDAGASYTITYGVSNALCIGNEASASDCEVIGNGYLFTGKIDEVRVYNYARSASQIAWDYNRGGPVAWWKMDECQGGTVYDWSAAGLAGSGINGTWFGTGAGTQTAVGTCTTAGTAWGNGATGKINSSLNFDGTDDYVDVGNQSVLDIVGDLTITAWIKKTTSAAGVIAAKNQSSNYGYWLYANDKLNFYGVNNSIVTSNQIINTGNWVHVVAIRNGTNVKLYINGVLDKNSDVGGTVNSAASSQTFKIGRRSDVASPWLFDSQIDDVRVYNYALTADQVEQVMNGGAVSFK